MLIARMIFWTIAVGLLAGAVHIVTVISLPNFTAQSAMAQAQRKMDVNVISAFTPGPDKKLPFQMENPDMEITVCRYDAHKAPVRFSGSLPGAYWSLAIYDIKGRNLFALNHAHRVFEKIDLIIDTKDRDIEAPEKTLVIQNASTAGIIVLRTFLPVRAYAQSIREKLKQLNCSAMSR